VDEHDTDRSSNGSSYGNWGAECMGADVFWIVLASRWGICTLEVARISGLKTTNTKIDVPPLRIPSLGFWF